MKKTLGIVVVIVVALPLLALLVSFTSSDEQNESWEYDDYRAISGVTDVEGALELVEVGSQTYVHAADLGTGTIHYGDGSSKIINVTRAHLDIYVIAGQSNTFAYLYLDPETVDPVPAPGTAYYYGNETRPVVNEVYNPDACSIIDIIKSDGTCRIGGFWPPMADKYHEITGHKSYYLNVGISGEAISTFLPGGDHWDHIENVLHYGTSTLNPDYYTWDIYGYIWLQGESDAGMASSLYETKFIQLNNALKDGDAGIKVPKAFIVKIREESSANVSAAQIWLGENVPGVYMLTTITDSFSVDAGTMAADNVHYSQTGCNELGVAAGEKLPDYLPPAPADVDDLEINGLLAVVPMFIIVLLFIGVASIIIRDRA